MSVAFAALQVRGYGLGAARDAETPERPRVAFLRTAVVVGLMGRHRC
jgi:hypothetical protein